MRGRRPAERPDSVTVPLALASGTPFSRCVVVLLTPDQAEAALSFGVGGGHSGQTEICVMRSPIGVLIGDLSEDIGNFV
jgi:hypothetical protein